MGQTFGFVPPYKVGRMAVILCLSACAQSVGQQPGWEFH